MKQDNQHLDFLLSQYVDDTLDPANRKLVEQRLATDPGARALLKEHREVQELLEDWGGRIPLIDWNEFDRTLAARLDQEAVAADHAAAWWRRLRPMAAAAALLVAAAIGYSWHAWTGMNSGPVIVTNPPRLVVPEMRVDLVDQPVAAGSRRTVDFPDYKGGAKGEGTAVAVDGPKGPENPRATDLPRRAGSAWADVPMTQPGGTDALR